jgi:predicted nucleotide-binding protein (sugar kinase/HSP70/actin superfamily)
MKTSTTSKTDTVFVPYMSDHAGPLAAVMRGMGVHAEALPPPDQESMRIGLDLCHGRECLPCFLTTGDLLRKCRDPGFDAERAVFFLPAGPGPCRFGQYSVLQKRILAEQGFEAVRFASPGSDDSYAMFGNDPTTLRKRAWQAIVATDLLVKVLHEHRPYELAPGSADVTYTACLERIETAAEAGCEQHMVDAMAWTADAFAQLPVDRSESRPLIAVMGEIYLMLCAPANSELVRTIESVGGEVQLGTLMDWLHFVDWRRKELSLRFGDYLEFLKGLVSGAYKTHAERKLMKPLSRVLRHPPEEPMPKAMGRLDQHYESVLGTEAVLTMARSLDLAQHGLSGIVNVLPFSCMPGTVVSTIAPRLREQMDNIPWLDIAYDGQEETNVMTRLEAFMHQALQFHRRVVLARD